MSTISRRSTRLNSCASSFFSRRRVLFAPIRGRHRRGRISNTRCCRSRDINYAIRTSRSAVSNLRDFTLRTAEQFDERHSFVRVQKDTFYARTRILSLLIGTDEYRDAHARARTGPQAISSPSYERYPRERGSWRTFLGCNFERRTSLTGMIGSSVGRATCPTKDAALTVNGRRNCSGGSRGCK